MNEHKDCGREICCCCPDSIEPTRPELDQPAPDPQDAPVRGGPHELMKQALEALEEFDALIKHQYTGSREAMSDLTHAAQQAASAITAIREYLATPEQEPITTVWQSVAAPNGVCNTITTMLPMGTPLYLSPTIPPGEVVVTTDASGRCVCVTRQDEEGQILSVIWEAEPIPPGYVLVPEEQGIPYRATIVFDHKTVEVSGFIPLKGE